MSKTERKKQNADLPAEQPQADEHDEEGVAAQQQAQTEQIIQTGAITATKGKYVIHCLTIVGQVEGHYILPPQNKTTKYEHVIPQLVAIQEDPQIEGLLIILNTVGGDVEAGLAIAELVSGMHKPTVSLVLGGGHSIGVPLAASAMVSFIAPTATMTIHPVRMNGLVLGVPQTLSYFDKMQERIVRFVEGNSKISGKKFRELMMKTGELVMDVGTVLDGPEAVKCGLIDNLGGLGDATACLYDLIEKQAKRKAREAKGSVSAKKQTPKPSAPKKAEPKVASPRALAQLKEVKRPIGRPPKNPPAAVHPHDLAGQGAAARTSPQNPGGAADKIPHTSAPPGHTMGAGTKSSRKKGGNTG